MLVLAAIVIASFAIVIIIAVSVFIAGMRNILNGD